MKLYQEFLLGQDSEVEKEVNVTGAIILRTNDEGTKFVLLIQRAADDHWPLVWETPRGKCDKNDENKLHECLKREVKEETGLDVNIVKFIDKYEYIADEGKRKSTQHNYLCTLKKPEQEVKLSKEHQDYNWVSTVGEIELLVPAEMKKTISRVLNKDEQIVNYPKTDEVIEETQNNWKKFVGGKNMKLTERSLKMIDKAVDKSIDLIQESTEYQEYFKSMLKKFGVKSPNQLDPEQKKKFFQSVKKGWAKKKKG